ncbi:type VI secretion system tip protein VgrG, partial [Pseudomonas aeruginosa]
REAISHPFRFDLEPGRRRSHPGLDALPEQPAVLILPPRPQGNHVQLTSIAPAHPGRRLTGYLATLEQRRASLRRSLDPRI